MPFLKAKQNEAHTYMYDSKFTTPPGVLWIEFYVPFDLLFETQKFMNVRM